MADDDREGRILIRRAADGTNEISVVDPRTGKEARTGLKTKEGPDTEAACRRLAETLRNSGARVSYREV